MFHRLPDRHQPRRRSGARGHPQPVRDAQPFAQDLARVHGGLDVPERPVWLDGQRAAWGAMRHPVWSNWASIPLCATSGRCDRLLAHRL